MQHIRQNEPAHAEGGIACGNRQNNHSQEHQDTTDHAAQQGFRSFGHHHRGRSGLHQHLRVTSVKRKPNGDPDQRDQALGDHAAVKDTARLPFRCHAARHHRRLGGMETGNGAAGDGHKHQRPKRRSLGMQIAEKVTEMQVGQHLIVRIDQQGDKEPEGHEEQQDREKWIDAADDPVNRKNCGQEVIEKNEHGKAQRQGLACNDFRDRSGIGDAGRCTEQSGQRTVAQPLQQIAAPADTAKQILGFKGQKSRRAVDENRSDQNHEPNGKDQHEPAHPGSQIAADHLRIGSAVVAQAHRAADKIMRRAGEDAAEHHPQQRRRAVERPQDRPKDRPQSGDVEKLDKKDFVGRQLYIVHAVGPELRWCGAAAIDAKDLFHKQTVDRIAQNQHQGCRKKTDHSHTKSPRKR